MQNVAQKASRISIRSNLSFQRDGGYIVQIQFDSAEFSVLFPEGLGVYPELTLREDHGRPTYAVACFSHLPYKTRVKRGPGGRGERVIWAVGPKGKRSCTILPFVRFPRDLLSRQPFASSFQ